jgi:hypothetical protein
MAAVRAPSGAIEPGTAAEVEAAAGLSTKSRIRCLDIERMSHGWRFAVRDVHLQSNRMRTGT